MRRLAVIGLIMLFLASSGLNFTNLQENGGIYAAPPSDGSAITITADETWSGNQILDGQVLISSTATVTIEGDISVADDASISVDGSLIMASGSSLLAQNPPEYMQLKYQDGTFSVPLDGQSGEVDITIDFIDLISGFEPRISIAGGDEIVASSSTTLSANVSGGTNEILVEMQFNPFSNPIVSNITVQQATGDPVVHKAMDLDSEGLFACCAQAWSLTINAGGSMTMQSSSSLDSAQITVVGSLALTGADIDRSGPILVTNDASFSAIGSSIDHSLTDEDVIAGLDSGILWESTSGTGGFVDHWIRVAPTQTIHSPVADAIAKATGLGWGNATLEGSFDDEGNWTIELSERIASLEDSSGVQWTEDAQLNVTWYGQWGEINVIENLEPSADHTVGLALPVIALDSLQTNSSETSISNPVTVTATITNSGSVDATGVKLDCTLADGNETRLSPVYPMIDVPSGQTVSLDFTWRGETPGEQTLQCSVMEPYGWLGGTFPEVSTQSVDWLELLDAGDGQPMVIAIITAGVVAIALGVLYAMRLANATHEEEITEEEDDAEEDEEKVDVVADELDED